MSMTKKERAEFDAAILRAETLAALRWTAPVERDLPPPTDSDSGYTSGWNINTHGPHGRGFITRAWSRVVTHGIGSAPSSLISGSQGGQWLFSTREKAVAALRHEIEKEAAEKLRRIDAGQIDEPNR